MVPDSLGDETEDDEPLIDPGNFGAPRQLAISDDDDPLGRWSHKIGLLILVIDAPCDWSVLGQQ